MLGASLLFFLGVVTGVGRRETVPPPAAIPLGVLDRPAGQGPSHPASPASTPEEEGDRTAATGPAPTDRTNTTGPAATPGGTGPTATTATPPSTNPASTAPSSTTTTRSGEVEQVDSQVNCRSQGKGKGKREPCPSTTTVSGEGSGGANNR